MKADATPPRVLLVIRDDPDRTAVAEAVRAAGHRATVVDQVTAALAELAENRPGVLLVDLALGSEALRLVRAASNQPKPLPVIAVADRRHPEVSAEALRHGAIDIVARPLSAADVQAALANASEFREAQAHGDLPEPELPDDGSMMLSVGLQKVIETVRPLSRSRCNVLIVGERGTGRERLAQAIHAQGQHADAPLVTIDCSYVASPTIPVEDVARFENELFDAMGRPFLLRNVGDLPLAVQGTLERLFVEHERASGHDGVSRVLASAEPSIGETVDRKLFRRDLFERLAAVRLDLPPLRQRPQDVPLLASLFLKDACRRHGLPPKTFAPPARALLAALPWRGNAGELRLLVERLALIVSRGVIRQEDVLAEVRFEGAETRGHAEGTLREARERFERDYITSVLQHHRGRMGAAARELGIERTNLYRKIKQLRIRL